MERRLDIDKPLWSQDTFLGRWKHFAFITDPRLCILREQELDKAKQLLEQYRKGLEPPNTKLEDVIRAKKIYESAFHPDSGEKQNVFGRMSFQMPGGCLITGAMLQWYRTVPAVIFWQWVNQSFNAFVNYTNRNAQSPITTTQMGIAYLSATSSAIAVVFGSKRFLEKRAGPLLQRYVPFLAVAAANCVNIPLMRQTEITKGLEVEDEQGKKLCHSKLAAVKGISQVVLSRIVMCAPGMTILPVIMEKLETYPWFKRMQKLHAPFQITAVGCFLTIMVPTACALFPQTASIKTSTLMRWEPDQYEILVKNCEGSNIPEKVYFNKGL
ncbi:sideroflexin-2 [Agrilus planipennis]|uniref:Sidoreflexin n=1 Tax=Agrilus planipennis TaxID=224129 RepID=A0A1W4X7R8_AGRPL|nr:sideroflexin-2 [Agrilus planipennis]XP_018328381.1 sideroflexin-2 [Agrilus planipennis]XP_018328383.1 sideroflexin-2 [Agrilus planipennis]